MKQKINWNETGECELRNIMELAKDKKARDKAFSLYKWDLEGEWELRRIMEFAKDKKARDRAEKELSKIKKTNMIYHIVIEGHNREQMSLFFEEIQNKYSLYDNCVFEECSPEDTIIDKDRYEETGNIIIDKKIVKKYGDE